MEGTSHYTVAVFDFDGTLTTKDTLLLFIRYACGTKKFFFGMILYSPFIFLMLLHLYPNWKCKEKIFSHFFKKMPYEEFNKKGISFANVFFEKIIRTQMTERLQWHLEQGHKVYVISASIEEWVIPLCKKLGNVTVLATKVKSDLSGFASPNCYGQEKINRLLQVEPKRKEYFLYAYGDSRGDKEMLSFADKSTLIS